MEVSLHLRHGRVGDSLRETPRKIASSRSEIRGVFAPIGFVLALGIGTTVASL